jgi:hypothetical protein
MFSFGTISHPASLVTEGAPRAKGRRHDTAFHPDRRATSMESSNAWPMSGVEVARAVTKDQAEREEPWRRRLTGAGFIMGLALALPVGL